MSKKNQRELKEIATELHKTMQQESADVIGIGRLLIEAKEQVEHGEWLPWLAGNFGSSVSTAANYMNAASFAAKFPTVVNLKLRPSALYVLGSELASDPYDGSLFVFRNKRGTALKILAFDGVGMWMFIRRFSQGKLRWWPTTQSDLKLHPLQAQQLSVLLYNGLPEQASFVSAWRALPHYQAARPPSTSSSVSSP